MANMKIVTINLPDQYLDCLDTLTNLGFYPSRSEAVRQSLKEFLINEQQVNIDFDKTNFEKYKKIQIDKMMSFGGN